MPTNYICRLIVATPSGATTTSVVTWMNNNLGLKTVPVSLGPGLSPTGNPPATFQWCSIAMTGGDAKQVLARLCTLAGVATPTPTQWDNATQAQRRAWWLSVRNNVWVNVSIWCQLADNDGDWDDAVAAAASRGLIPISTP